MRKNIYRFIINLGLIISGVATVFSGLLIQIKYHMGSHGHSAINDTVLGMSKKGWSDIHKTTILVLSALMIYHIYQHWEWYKVVIRKQLIAKNKQVIILSIFFGLVAITGFIPWSIDFLKGGEMLRKVFIEIHDKLALIFSVYLLLHMIKKLKWFFSAYSHLHSGPRNIQQR
jgi:hypothetical protein